MTFCIKCGEKMQPEAAYCFACGAKKVNNKEGADVDKTSTEKGSRPVKQVKSEPSHASHASVSAATAPEAVTLFETETAPITATAVVAKTPNKNAIESDELAERVAESQAERLINTSRPDGSDDRLNLEIVASAPKSKRRRFLKIFAALIIVPLCLFGGFLVLYFLNAKSNTPPEALFTKSANANVQTNFDNEKQRLEELIKTHEDLLIRQEVEFEIAQASRRITDLGKFVDKYPETPYYSEALKLASLYLEEQSSLLAFRTFEKYFGYPSYDYTGRWEVEYSDNLTIVGKFNEDGFFGDVKWINPNWELEGIATGGYVPNGPGVFKFDGGTVVKGVFEGEFKLVGEYTCQKPNGDYCRLPEDHPFFRKD